MQVAGAPGGASSSGGPPVGDASGGPGGAAQFAGPRVDLLSRPSFAFRAWRAAAAGAGGGEEVAAPGAIPRAPPRPPARRRSARARPMTALTLHLASTYGRSNPGGFVYSSVANPRRALTKVRSGRRRAVACAARAAAAAVEFWRHLRGLWSAVVTMRTVLCVVFFSFAHACAEFDVDPDVFSRRALRAGCVYVVCVCVCVCVWTGGGGSMCALSCGMERNGSVCSGPRPAGTAGATTWSPTSSCTYTT